MKLVERLSAIPPYTPIEPFEVLSAKLGRTPETIIKLNANENPYGPSPKARSALAEMRFPHIYPDPESRALREELARFTGVPEANLMAGAGADELIDLILRVMIEPGDCVINCPPTFGMYSFDTNINAGRVLDVERKQDFSLDIEEITKIVKEYQPKIIFLTTPNNPDGSMPEPEVIDRILDLPLLVVIDEAYIEFCSDGGVLGQERTRIRQVVQRQNLVVLRTFSKWAGLAGLRVGYGAFPAWMMPTLWKVKQPYNVNVAASVAAIASLNDLEYLSDHVETLKFTREILFDELKTVPYLLPYPSQANFILCEVIGRSAFELTKLLEREAILIRYYETRRLKNFIRISIGRPEECKTLIETLARLQ